MMKTTLIQDACIVNEGQMFQGSVLIEGERIVRIYKGDDTPSLSVMESLDNLVDARGKYLIPGLIDTHVHFRDPGLTHKADMTSESKAAIAGGVTSFIDMPNTQPQTTTLKAWQDKMDYAASHALANYAFYIGATNENLEELLAADYTKVPAVKLFMGSSTGNMLVDDEQSLQRLFTEVPTLIAVHCESESRIQ
ncbi:MAG: amidohydrolase family protein, partial [Bacteroidales bacterium]|nr:amidohydrolase family protein [Bacteroidales bacterium]